MTFTLTRTTVSFLSILSLCSFAWANKQSSYAIVDTGQNSYFGNKSYISKPNLGEAFFGQDATYVGNQPSYSNNTNGTITDNNTGLIWQKSISDKLSWHQAVEYANNSTLGGYSDWRIPTIKELYSLINFEGKTGTSRNKSTLVPNDAKPYIDTDYFDFEYSKQRRYIDAQYWTQTDYVSTTMKGNETFFGVNFADGRIKGYPKYSIGNRGSSIYYLRLVRGNKKYGKNDFYDKDNGTIYDQATKLLWMKYDSGSKYFTTTNNNGALNWEEALSFCENLDYVGVDSWRLPNAKELHSIVDYSKSPDTSRSAAINKLFYTTVIKNTKNQIDYPFYWASTTHLDGPKDGSTAVYFAFGRALGYMRDRRTNSRELLDVHGAGAQRSDPKSGDASRYPYGRGPQGDVIKIDNYVRCVSDEYSALNTLNSKERNFHIKESFSKYAKKPEYEQKLDAQDTKSSNASKHVKKVLKRFDKDGDDRISYEEAPKRMKENFKRHDENMDGYLSKNELDTLPRPR